MAETFIRNTSFAVYRAYDAYRDLAYKGFVKGTIAFTKSFRKGTLAPANFAGGQELYNKTFTGFKNWNKMRPKLKILTFKQWKIQKGFK